MRLREVSGEFLTHLERIRVAALLVVPAFCCLVIWESPKTYPKQVTSRFARRYDQFHFVNSVAPAAVNIVAGDFYTIWRVADLARHEVAVSAAEDRTVREVEAIVDAAEDEADQTRLRIFQHATKKAISLRNALNRSG